MLSSLRFIIGAILAGATLYVSALGLLATARLKHMAKAGPIEVSRHLLFDDRVDWNQFYYPDSARRFEQLARKREASEPAETPAFAAPRALEQAAPAASVVPAAGKSSEELPAEQSEAKPPAAAAVESKPPDHNDSDAAPPIGTPPAAAPVAATATTAPATSIDPPPAEHQTVSDEQPATPPSDMRDMISAVSTTERADPGPTQASTPVRDEEPPIIPAFAAPQAEERKTSAPAAAGSAIVPAPLAAHAAAHGTDRPGAARPRRATSKARPARDPDDDEPAQRTHIAKRPHAHASRSVAQPYHDAPAPLYRPVD